MFPRSGLGEAGRGMVWVMTSDNLKEKLAGKSRPVILVNLELKNDIFCVLFY